MYRNVFRGVYRGGGLDGNVPPLPLFFYLNDLWDSNQQLPLLFYLCNRWDLNQHVLTSAVQSV